MALEQGYPSAKEESLRINIASIFPPKQITSSYLHRHNKIQLPCNPPFLLAISTIGMKILKTCSCLQHTNEPHVVPVYFHNIRTIRKI